MEILLPPRIDSASNECQRWHIPDALITAEHQFRTHVHSLLQKGPGQWIYMTEEGLHEVFKTQDEADIAAEKAGLQHGTFVVRHISPLEAEDEEMEISFGGL